jgi:hypothetical protein
MQELVIRQAHDNSIPQASQDAPAAAKEEGNRHYGKGDLSRALECYSRAGELLCCHTYALRHPTRDPTLHKRRI